MYSSLYPSIILENNIAPNTQIGKLIIEDPNNPDRSFGLMEHRDMYSNDDQEAKYSRGGELLDNMMSENPLEFCRRWMGLGDIYDVIEDAKEYFSHNSYKYGCPIDMDSKDAVYFNDKNSLLEAVKFDNRDYMNSNAVIFDNPIDKETCDELIEKVKKGALL